MNLRGTGVAIITPFKNYEIDFTSLTKMVNHVIDGGVDYIVALGSTGEAAGLDVIEQKKVLDGIIEASTGRKNIVAGNFAGNSTKQIIERIKNYDFKGISALLISSPAYVKPTQEGIVAHYTEIADIAPIPIIMYNVPGRTCSNMTWETTVELSKHENIIGIKEATGDISQCTKIIANTSPSFYLTSGDDESALATTAVGGDGVISVIANAFPSEFSTMIKLGLSGDFDKARELNNMTFALHQYLYTEGNPTGIKAACNVLGLCEKEVRSPLTELTSTNYQKLEGLMKGIQL